MRGDRDGAVSAAAAAPGHDGQGGGEWGEPEIVEREKVTELGWRGWWHEVWWQIGRAHV